MSNSARSHPWCFMASMVPTAALVAAAASTQLAPVNLSERMCNDKRFWKLTLFMPSNALFDNLEEFCHTLAQNTTVTSVEITSEFFQSMTNSDQIALLETISRLQRLDELTMKVVVDQTSVLTAALKHASNLRSLCIEKLRLSSDQEVVELANAIKELHCLRQISLASVHERVHGNHVMDARGMDDGRNKIVLDPLLHMMSTLPVLEHIRLQHHLGGSKVQPPSESSLRSLCHSPRRSLIFNSCGLADEQCVVIADELKSNKASATLSVLVVTRNYQITSAGWDAFVNMLAINEKVVDFFLGEDGQWNAPSPVQRAKIDYFVGLNQRGRGELLRGPMEERRKAWFRFLLRGRDDLDLVFFALLVDPSLYIALEGH